MRTVFAPLRRPGLRRLLIAQVPADLSDWLDFVALFALLAFAWEAGPHALAILFVCMGLPYIFVGPLAGAVIDRADLRRALVLSNAARAGVTLSLAFAPNLPVLLVLVALRSSADAFFTPAKQAAIPALVPDPGLTAANALSHMINQASKIAGPGLGGALLLVLAPGQIFFVNAAVSALAAVLLAGLPADLRPPPPPAAERERLVGRILQGLGAYRARPSLAAALCIMAAGFGCFALYDAQIPLLTRSLGFDETVFGVAIAAVGFGGVAGALLVGNAGDRVGAFATMGGGAIAGGLLTAPLGLAGGMLIDLQVVAFVLIFGVLGIATAAMTVPYRTVLQRMAPPDAMARVVAVGEGVTTLAMLLVPLAGAVLVQVFGIGAPFLVGATGMLLLGAVTLSAVLRRRLR